MNCALPSRAESMLSRVLAALGITVNPGQIKAPGDPYANGDIYLAQPGQGAAQPLTTDGGYRSPVFGRDGETLALKGETLVSIAAAGGPPVELRTIKGVRKVLGTSKENPNEVIALIEHEGVMTLATVARTRGEPKVLAHDASSSQDMALLAALQEDARDYGADKLYLKTQTKLGTTGRTIEWTDVYLKRGSATPLNVSQCDGRNCVQPALAPQSGRVVFVRSTD